VTSAYLLTLDISRVLRIDFRLRLVTSSFVWVFHTFDFVYFNRVKIINLSVWFLILYMLCILHFSCKPKKLIGQNQIKFCKL